MLDSRVSRKYQYHFPHTTREWLPVLWRFQNYTIPEVTRADPVSPCTWSKLRASGKSSTRAHSPTADVAPRT